MAAAMRVLCKCHFLLYAITLCTTYVHLRLYAEACGVAVVTCFVTLLVMRSCV
jgi:hypothetical protein